MVKYRRLSDAELKEMEEELKQFLIANGIYDEEWVELNKKEPEKALRLVDEFSNIVLEKGLETTKYLIHTSKDMLNAFWFQKEKAMLIQLNCMSKELDFTAQDWMLKVPEIFDEITFKKQEKPVAKENRNAEVFKLISAGALVCDEQYFKSLVDLTKV